VETGAAAVGVEIGAAAFLAGGFLATASELKKILYPYPAKVAF